MIAKRKIAATALIAATLAGCGSTSLFNRDRPDEMAVQRQAPLVVPPRFLADPARPRCRAPGQRIDRRANAARAVRWPLGPQRQRGASHQRRRCHARRPRHPQPGRRSRRASGRQGPDRPRHPRRPRRRRAKRAGGNPGAVSFSKLPVLYLERSREAHRRSDHAAGLSRLRTIGPKVYPEAAALASQLEGLDGERNLLLQCAPHPRGNHSSPHALIAI